MIRFGSSPSDKYIKTIYYLGGLWFSKKPSLPYRIYSFFLLFIFLLPYVICMNIGLALSDNLSQATKTLCSCLPVAVSFVKAMNLYANNDRIQSCLRQVHEFRLLNHEEKAYAKRQLAAFFNFTLFFLLMCNGAITYFCWRVVVLVEPELPFGAWYPLDWQHSNRDFWIAQSYQFYGMVILANINIALDLFPCFFLTAIGCQLDILGFRMKKLNREWSTDDVEDKEPDETSKQSTEGKHTSKQPVQRKPKQILKLIDEHVQTHYYIMEYAMMNNN